MVVILGILHFLPSLIGRKRPDILLIFLVNLLAGWSVIGWFVALYLALRSTTTTLPSVVVGAAPAASVADELRKLRDLRDQGVLTAQEFEAQKAILLG